MSLSDRVGGIPFPSRRQRTARAQMEPSRQRVADAYRVVPRPCGQALQPARLVCDVTSRAEAGWRPRC